MLVIGLFIIILAIAATATAGLIALAADVNVESPDIANLPEPPAR